jgi:hypothetical protein
MTTRVVFGTGQIGRLVGGDATDPEFTTRVSAGADVGRASDLVDDAKYRIAFGEQATPLDDAPATTPRRYRDRSAADVTT